MSAPAIAVVTSTRAEWGLLKPFCAALRDLDSDVRVVATGTHLSRAFGETWRQIMADGFTIDEKIPILLDSDTPLGEAKTMALALSGTASYLDRRRPDAVLLLGDRYETLGIAEAAFLAQVPIVHIHGGEITEGAVDDAMRHCITKLASLHLTCCDEYRRRVIQLGEDPSTVFDVGAVGVENALTMPLLTRDELLSSLGIRGVGKFAMLTYHPVTLGSGNPVEELDVVLDAALESGLEVIATKANADAGGRAINTNLEKRAASDSRIHVFASLGSLRYMSAVRAAEVVIGNSSSGILEAPALGTPTVNIGERQKGRVRPAGVIDVPLEFNAIRNAVTEATSPKFAEGMRDVPNPYGDGHTSEKSAHIIVDALSKGFPRAKVFFDLHISRD